jgi:hypothetical protein
MPLLTINDPNILIQAFICRKIWRFINEQHCFKTFEKERETVVDNMMPPPPTPPQLFDHPTFKMPGVFEAMLFICAPTLAV